MTSAEGPSDVHGQPLRTRGALGVRRRAWRRGRLGHVDYACLRRRFRVLTGGDGRGLRQGRGRKLPAAGTRCCWPVDGVGLACRETVNVPEWGYICSQTPTPRTPLPRSPFPPLFPNSHLFIPRDSLRICSQASIQHSQLPAFKSDQTDSSRGLCVLLAGGAPIVLHPGCE